MRIYGLDFTSAPGPRKPITLAVALLTGTTLTIEEVQTLPSFDAFDAFLASPGPWVAALDFPFGQPRRLLDNLHWPTAWAEYVARFGALAPTAFEALLREYRAPRAPGDKEHNRRTDAPDKANARSPMHVGNPPVGKMFLQGAPRLLRAPVSIRPCRPTDDPQIVVEGYPALVARWALAQHNFPPRTSYKNDPPDDQARPAARTVIMSALQSQALLASYGISLALPPALAQAVVADPSGDLLDAMLCAIQAAWSWTRRATDWGIPATADADEGWIVDPALLD